ncbi:TPA: hypothetical protein N0F65_012220 [Lagenidium giganteum]|uniref:Uncharacterized protein n=1 Tax=Lagenidium giganteum TaxID=4803 RepID=A0AAV2ZHS3_9STRA|nr:TPA: hypothetical protein N0F65_012220 [Lagenidium giganteum]
MGGNVSSMGKLLKSFDDDDLVAMVEEALRLDPTRMDRILTKARLQYLEKLHPEITAAAVTAAANVNAMSMAPAHASATSAAAMNILIPTPGPAALDANAPTVTEAVEAADAASAPAPSYPALAKDVAMLGGGMEEVTATTTENEEEDASTATVTTATGESRNPMNALWSFEGHVLRQLQSGDKQTRVVSEAGAPSGGAGTSMSARAVDEDGNLILFGSCGRDKRYARCSVCYFRGLRCNTAHYCACCQRPICIRPRKYPGEEHPKICWNVLHVDKDMINRVQKKKKRKLHDVAAPVEPISPHLVTSGASAPTTLVSNANAMTDSRHADSLGAAPVASASVTVDTKATHEL